MEEKGAQLVLQDDAASAVMKIQEPEDVKAFLKDLDTLKKLLDAAGKFNEMARKYLQLEAAAYVRIVELGFENNVPSSYYRRSIVTWLASLSEEERLGVVDECAKEGVSIAYYWRHVVHEEEMVKEAIDYYKYMGGRAINEFRENGMVDLNKYLEIKSEKESQRIPEDFKVGFKDRVRDRIRRLGGHGVGDGDGIYVSVEKANGYAEDILENKMSSMRKDMKRFIATLNALKSIGDFDMEMTIERDARNNYKTSVEGSFGVAMVLAGFGEARFEYSEVPTAKMVAQICEDLGWPVLKVKKTIEDEYRESHGYSSDTGLRLLGYGYDIDTSSWKYEDEEFSLFSK